MLSCDHKQEVETINQPVGRLSSSFKSRVALVYMPWGSVSRASMAAGILKECANRSGYRCDVHYLNIWFAQQIGIDLYAKISENYAFSPEWFFSCELFGKTGLGVLNNSWNDLSAAGGDQLKRDLVQMLEGSSIRCEELAREAVPQFIARCINQIDWS